jgi:hypothetical protein
MAVGLAATTPTAVANPTTALLRGTNPSRSHFPERDTPWGTGLLANWSLLVRCYCAS